jgi:hypothetical protein
MDDRKGKSSIFDRILRDGDDLRLGDLHYLRDADFKRILRDSDLHNLLIVREAMHGRLSLKEVDDLKSALLSAKKRAERGKRHIVIPPGSKLLTIAEFFYSKKTYTLHFEPIVADMQREYFEALYEKRVWKARWIHIRGCWGFISAMGLNICVSLLDKAWKAWKMSDK